MPITLDIGGRRVQVDDGFLRLSPDQQQSSVEEIARSLGVGQQPAPVQTPPNADPIANNTPFAASSMENLQALQLQRKPDLLGSVLATGSGLINGVPILGPALTGAVDLIPGARQVRQDAEFNNPVANTIGNVTGAIGSMIPLGMTSLGAKALGLTGSLGARTIAGTASGGAISGLDTLARGGDLNQATGNAMLGAGIGGALPGLGAGVRAGWNAIGGKAQPVVGALTNTTNEAMRRVGMAANADARLNPAALPTAADEVTAQQAGLGLLNADRGGELLKAQSRAVMNQSPTARQLIEDTVNQRYATQSTRAADVIRGLAGGNADDLAFQEGLRQTAKAVNKPAYDAVRGVVVRMTPNYKFVLQTPMGMEAFKAAAKTLQNKGTIVNKFTVGWIDQAKRELDSIANVAKRQGNNELAATAGDLANVLKSETDKVVPAYAKARAGAALFFGVDDAVDAGKLFANSPRKLPEAKQFFAAATNEEKQAFRVGFASEQIDVIKATNDRTNIIDKMFKSPAARELNELVYGRQGARELEAYVRVEDIAQRLKLAMGNSTTARQLVELGLAGGQIGGSSAAGFALGGPVGAIVGAVMAAGSRHLDQKVLVEMAKILTSSDPALMQQAMQKAAASPMHMNVLEAIGKVVAPATRGSVPAVQQQMAAPPPLQITVSGANRIEAR